MISLQWLKLESSNFHASRLYQFLDFANWMSYGHGHTRIPNFSFDDCNHISGTTVASRQILCAGASLRVTDYPLIGVVTVT